MLAATASADNTVSIWNLNKIALVKTYTGHTNDVLCVEFLDARNIASGSVDNTIQIWEITSGKNIKTLKSTQWVTSLLLLPTGLLMSGNLIGTLNAWDIKDGTISYTLANSHKGSINALALINETRVASGGNDFKGCYFCNNNKKRIKIDILIEMIFVFFSDFKALYGIYRPRNVYTH